MRREKNGKYGKGERVPDTRTVGIQNGKVVKKARYTERGCWGAEDIQRNAVLGPNSAETETRFSK